MSQAALSAPPAVVVFHFVHTDNILMSAGNNFITWDSNLGPFTSDVDQNATKRLIPKAGTLKNLRVRLDGAPGGTTSYTITVRVNETDTSIEVTISGDDTTGTDLTNTATVSAGDRLSIRVTRGSGASSARPLISLDLS